MSYAIERNETVCDAVVRIAGERVVRAREQLLDPSLTPERRVHEARKRLKEIRAVIRLVRHPLGDRYREDNALFRDAARTLAPLRDADAVAGALKKLDLAENVRAAAEQELDRQRDHPPAGRLIARAAHELAAAHSRIVLWPRMEDSFATLAPGLRDAYRGGRRRMRTAQSDEELHDWRALAKRHWYHVQLLRNVAPEVFEPYAEVMHELGDKLGDHHDLHELRERLPGFGGGVMDAIAKKQKSLEREAREIGANVYAEPSKAWLARIEKLWNAWRR